MGVNYIQTGEARLSFIDDATSKELLRVDSNGVLAGDIVQRVTFADDFLGDVIGTNWNSRKGSDGAATDWAVSTAVNGMVRGVTGAGAGASMAVNGVQLDSFLNWRASNGDLVFQARVKISAITNVAVFVGLTDQVAALEMPATISSTTYTTNFTDGCGFLFDTGATSATIRCVGVAADTDATHTDTGLAFVADTYRTFRIELSTAGVARFYIDGVVVNSGMTGAVTTSVALTPVVVGFARAAASRNIDVDYVACQQNR